VLGGRHVDAEGVAAVRSSKGERSEVRERELVLSQKVAHLSQTCSLSR